MGVHYGKRQILRDVTLSVQRGEFTAIIGPNGAGKSTLLGLFNGMTPHSAGQAFFKGRPVQGRGVHAARLEIAHVFQAADFDHKMPISVLESVLGGMYGKLGLFHRPGEHERQIACESLATVGLLHLADRPIGQLSGGECQRVALARALAQQPALLLLDEPTASLDWQAQRAILDSISALRRCGEMAIIMVTHDLNAVFALADTVIMMREGRIFWQGPAPEAKDEALLSELFSVNISLLTGNGRTAALF
ncbi:MAG: metal ABC transporter ATP-binding protein [Desulfovibrio sp.]|nr:metal ABC transporter ATP-binding protein [Desulfovibrio sp.]